MLSNSDDFRFYLFANSPTKEDRGTVQSFLKGKVDAYVLVVSNEDAGWIIAQNTLFAMAQEEYYVCMNNDVIVGPAWLQYLSRPLEEDPSVWQTSLVPTFGYLGENFIGIRPKGRRIDYLEASCMMVRRDQIRRTFGQLFDAGNLDLVYSEDADLSLRIREAGGRICPVVAPIIHFHGLTTRSLANSRQGRRVAEAAKRNAEYGRRRWSAFLAQRRADPNANDVVWPPVDYGDLTSPPRSPEVKTAPGELKPASTEKVFKIGLADDQDRPSRWTLGEVFCLSRLPRELKARFPESTVEAYLPCLREVFLNNPYVDTVRNDPLPEGYSLPPIVPVERRFAASPVGTRICRHCFQCGILPEEESPDVFLTENELNKAREKAESLDIRKPFAIVEPEPLQQGLEKLEEVLKHTLPGMQIIWFSDASSWETDESSSRRKPLRSSFPGWRNRLRFRPGQPAYKTRLLMSIFSLSSFFVGGTGVGMHLAAAFEIPSLIVLEEGANAERNQFLYSQQAHLAPSPPLHNFLDALALVEDARRHDTKLLDPDSLLFDSYDTHRQLPGK